MLKLATAFPKPFDGARNVNVADLGKVGMCRKELLFVPIDQASGN